MKETEKAYFQYNYESRRPLRAEEGTISSEHMDLLTKSKHFCMLPWLHLHSCTSGNAYPCCFAQKNLPLGDLKKTTLENLWNSEDFKLMRKNMLEDKASPQCTNCYEQEKAGFKSFRHSISQDLGHNVGLIDSTKPDGSLDWFQLRYIDVRFSNLCNFRCRSCGFKSSSNWYNDEVKLHGPKPEGMPRVIYAGRHEDDMWEQMLLHIPYLEKIYFAGGEPLIMEEHYRLLMELHKRQMWKVQLIYNTNFSQLQYKNQNVLNIWPHFELVSIGASLDASGKRGELLRKGQDWQQTVDNRKRMMEKCPSVNFYINATISIYNVMHVMDFHREWVEQGLIQPHDFNINILQSPKFLRVDCLPGKYKHQVSDAIDQHIAWLEPLDEYKRATIGYRSLQKFLIAQDNHQHLPEFFNHADQLDKLRGEDIFQVFPELNAIRFCVSNDK
jgi:radical SAM protein with 4Fe4S-binding SPASM domain